MRLTDIQELIDKAPIGPWERMDRDNLQFIMSARTLLPILLEIANAAEYLERHVNRDHAEWKQPLFEAFEKLEKL